MDSKVIGLQIPSPVERVMHPLLTSASIHLSVKREDLIDPEISGNKWRKLKYNIAHALAHDYGTLVTFGGAFSNHVYATAAAAERNGIACVGIIRGEYDQHNPTLTYARNRGMQLYFVDRSAYREKKTSAAVQKIILSLDRPYIIPEGGSNTLAKRGLAELAHEINLTDSNIVLVSAGTGMTAAGILDHLAIDKELWVFSSLKSDHLRDEILDLCDTDRRYQLRMITDQHYGGYGKTPFELVRSINEFRKETGIAVDPIYNGKLVCGLMEMIVQNQVEASKKYLWIHTGGLQGITAYNFMAAKKRKTLIS